MDEKPYQLIGEAREPLAARPGDKKMDTEYKRCGTCSIFVFTEVLAGWHHVSVWEHQTRLDWATGGRYILTEVYPDKKKIILVMDNLNTHTKASLYQAFPDAEATALANCLEIYYTLKHGSWLNVTEIELNATTRQCLDRRIEDIDILRREVSIWESERNEKCKSVDWQFTAEYARIKLKSLYPKIIF